MCICAAYISQNWSLSMYRCICFTIYVIAVNLLNFNITYNNKILLFWLIDFAKRYNQTNDFLLFIGIILCDLYYCFFILQIRSFTNRYEQNKSGTRIIRSFFFIETCDFARTMALQHWFNAMSPCPWLAVTAIIIMVAHKHCIELRLQCLCARDTYCRKIFSDLCPHLVRNILYPISA